MGITLLGIGLLYFLAHLLSVSFQRTHVPDVLVLVTIGIVVGPLTGMMPEESFGTLGHVLSTVALALILFEGGTELDLRAIAKSAGTTMLVTGVTVVLTIIIVMLAVRFGFGVSWISAALVGTICSGTSPAVVIPMMKSLKVRESVGTLLVLETALADVASIVLTFGLLQAVEQGAFDVGHIVGQTLSALVFAAVIGVAGGLGWLLVWERVRQLPSTIFTTLAGAFVLYGAAEILGFSGAIAVLAFGVTLANHSHPLFARILAGRPLTGVTPTESVFYAEIVFLLKTFFFVYLGISMRADSPRVILVAVGVTVAIYLARALVASRLAPADITRREAGVIAMMVPKGLAAAVLANLPLEAGLPDGELIRGLVYAIVLVSIVLTAALVALRDVGPVAAGFNRLLARYPISAEDSSPGGTPSHGIERVEPEGS